MAFDDLRALVNAECQSAFGDEVTYTPPTPPGGSEESVIAILDFTEAARSKDRGIAGTAFVVLADFLTPPVKNGIIEFDGVEYRITNDPTDQRDGRGGTFLHLRKK